MEAELKVKKMGRLRKSLIWFYNLPIVQRAQISLVILGDVMALASLYPSHSMHISRPFLAWRRWKKGHSPIPYIYFYILFMRCQKNFNLNIKLNLNFDNANANAIANDVMRRPWTACKSVSMRVCVRVRVGVFVRLNTSFCSTAGRMAATRTWNWNWSLLPLPPCIVPSSSPPTPFPVSVSSNAAVN